MGNCCGSQSALDDDDSRPAQPRPAASRPSKPRKPTTGPGHTLGGPPADTSGGVDPRTAAAIAAQERNQAAAKGGKLASQLAADKSKSRQQHLVDASTENRQGSQEPLRWD